LGLIAEMAPPGVDDDDERTLPRLAAVRRVRGRHRARRFGAMLPCAYRVNVLALYRFDR